MECLHGLVYAASKETAKEGCERLLEKIKEVNESAYWHLNGIEYKLWAIYAMDKPNYGHVTSNIAEESNNSVLKVDRALTVCGMLSEFYKRLDFQFEERVKCIAGNNDNYVFPRNTGKNWHNWEKQNSGWMLLICPRKQQQQWG